MYIRNNYAPINVILSYHRYGMKAGKDVRESIAKFFQHGGGVVITKKFIEAKVCVFIRQTLTTVSKVQAHSQPILLTDT